MRLTNYGVLSISMLILLLIYCGSMKRMIHLDLDEIFETKNVGKVPLWIEVGSSDGTASEGKETEMVYPVSHDTLLEGVYSPIGIWMTS